LPYVPGDKDDDLNASRREISKLEGDGAIAILLRPGCEKNRDDF
jgi:hypothetical protein